MLAMIAFVMLAISPVLAQTDPLPSWNDGPAKKAIIDFVQVDDRQVEPEVCSARGAHRHL